MTRLIDSVFITWGLKSLGISTIYISNYSWNIIFPTIQQGSNNHSETDNPNLIISGQRDNPKWDVWNAIEYNHQPLCRSEFILGDFPFSKSAPSRATYFNLETNYWTDSFMPSTGEERKGLLCCFICCYRLASVLDWTLFEMKVKLIVKIEFCMA